MECEFCDEWTGCDCIENDFDPERYEDDQSDRWECEFPGKCLMPGVHTSDECHTSEMMAAYYAEMEKES